MRVLIAVVIVVMFFAIMAVIYQMTGRTPPAAFLFILVPLLKLGDYLYSKW